MYCRPMPPVFQLNRTSSTILWLLIGACLASPAWAAVRHELVVHWPDQKGVDYRRVFATLEACQRGRAAVLAEYQRRVAEAVANARRNGLKLIVPPTAPYAICIALD